MSKISMTTSQPRNKYLKWGIAASLVTMLVGTSAIAYWMPVKRYVVTCTRSQTVSCELQRETSSRQKSWHVDLGSKPAASVEIQPVRRGAARVFLYLRSNSASFFAAEFEGASARADAKRAAATLNSYFASSQSAPVRIIASPPTYLTWMLWGGMGFLGVLVLVICRAMFGQK